ncbi:MAG: Sec-independent protein translocase protein TatB [Burkholderiales bacterium]|nr:Sec-independent protein translocase protein TatB [Burkholderiales bacterium]
MFDIAFTELLVIGVVALLVIGPERLPKVARTAGILFGRFQRYVANVKGDIQREMDASELSKLKTEVQDAARSFEQSVNEQTREVESNARELEQSLTAVNDPPKVASTEPAPPGVGAGTMPAVDQSAPEQTPPASGEYSPPSTQQKLIG